MVVVALNKVVLFEGNVTFSLTVLSLHIFTHFSLAHHTSPVATSLSVTVGKPWRPSFDVKTPSQHCFNPR